MHSLKFYSNLKKAISAFGSLNVQRLHNTGKHSMGTCTNAHTSTCVAPNYDGHATIKIKELVESRF